MRVSAVCGYSDTAWTQSSIQHLAGVSSSVREEKQANKKNNTNQSKSDLPTVSLVTTRVGIATKKSAV